MRLKLILPYIFLTIIAIFSLPINTFINEYTY